MAEPLFAPCQRSRLQVERVVGADHVMVVDAVDRLQVLTLGIPGCHAGHHRSAASRAVIHGASLWTDPLAHTIRRWIESCSRAWSSAANTGLASPSAPARSDSRLPWSS